MPTDWTFKNHLSVGASTKINPVPTSPLADYLATVKRRSAKKILQNYRHQNVYLYFNNHGIYLVFGNLIVIPTVWTVLSNCQQAGWLQPNHVALDRFTINTHSSQWSTVYMMLEYHVALDRLTINTHSSQWSTVFMMLEYHIALDRLTINTL